jgi:hypothetical protein
MSSTDSANRQASWPKTCRDAAIFHRPSDPVVFAPKIEKRTWTDPGSAQPFAIDL